MSRGRFIKLLNMGFTIAVLWVGVISGSGCSPSGSSIKEPSKLPSRFAHWLSDRPGAASAILLKQSFPNSSSYLIRGIEDPAYGSTFSVNLDPERRIIKLRPVQDISEAIILYDPFNQASRKNEIGSNYTMIRCSCGGFRFQLSMGVFYVNNREGDDYSQWILAGKCTSCNLERILFQDS